MISYLLAVLSGIVVLGIDQYTKCFIDNLYTANGWQLGYSTEFLPGFIDITYIYNEGAAWGMLSGHTWLLVSITVVVMLVCIAMLLKFGFKDKLMFWAIMLVLSGGVGNMIDRIFRDGKVIDFLRFEFIDFPIFNVADCSIVIGAGLLMLYFLIGMVKDVKMRRADINSDGISKADSSNDQ